MTRFFIHCSVHLMADLPLHSKPRNPNWGGRREGSGRKRRTVVIPVPTLSVTTPSNTLQVMPTEHPARGFFAPRNHLKNTDTAPSVVVDHQANGALPRMITVI